MVAAVLLMVVSAQAWEPVGPVEASVTCGAASASSPQVMYIVGRRPHAQALMRSTDRGAGWASVNDSLPFLARVILVNPSDAAVLYALSSRVQRSTDSGGSWSELPAPPGIWFGLFVDPVRPQLLLAVGCSRVGADDRAAFARSTDQGATWQLTRCDTTAGSGAYSVTVDPVDTNTVYCGGYAHGRVFVYKSTDGGGSWTSSDVGAAGQGAGPDSVWLDSYPSESPGSKCPRCLLVSPSNRRTVLLGTFGSGMYRSTDGGTNWNRITVTPLNTTYTLAAARRTPEVIYAGCGDEVLHSTDGGVNWEGWWSGAFGRRNRCVIVPADSAGQVFCGNELGFFRGTAPGRYWSLLHLFQSGIVPAVVFSGSEQAMAYVAVAGDGVYSSRDSGGTWSACSSFRDAGRVCGLASAGSGRVWAMTNGGSSRAGLYWSADSGNSWHAADTSFEMGGAVAASWQGFVAAVGSARDSIGQMRFGVITSADGGNSWRRSLLCASGLGRSVAVSPLVSDWILAAGDSAGVAVIYSTRDTGRSWQRLDSGVVGSVSSVLFSPWTGGPLVCGTTQGVYWSDNGGLSWSYSGLSQVRAVTVDWYERYVFAASRTGVFRSDVRSGQWSDFNTGLANPDVLCLFTSSDSSGYQVPALAGTNGSGLFRDWLYHVGTREETATPPSALPGPTILPNPFRGRTRVSLPPGESDLVSVGVFNSAGREVATIRRGDVQGGTWTWDWDAHELPAGTYFVRISCGGRAFLSRAVLLK
ncbi:MAG: T9SS type A sorting domain-containing protein [candidate division WOR-3 bacterium]|nr:T9SS type A sorting domain-containing protein [candidate division WOR-3 bacterium]